jgi:hypothetical protein
MNYLLKKIQKVLLAEMADLRKASNSANPVGGKLAESGGLETERQKASDQSAKIRQCGGRRNPHHRAISANPPNPPRAELKSDIQNQPGIATNPKKRLIQLAIEEGIYEHALKLEEKEVAALVPPSDWRDTEQCTPEELKAWGMHLALRAIRYRGQVPTGWDQIANCNYCGPVWCRMPGEWDLCPWCEQKRAGKWFPQPEEQP